VQHPWPVSTDPTLSTAAAYSVLLLTTSFSTSSFVLLLLVAEALRSPSSSVPSFPAPLPAAPASTSPRHHTSDNEDAQDAVGDGLRGGHCSRSKLAATQHTAGSFSHEKKRSSAQRVTGSSVPGQVGAAASSGSTAASRTWSTRFRDDASAPVGWSTVIRLGRLHCGSLACRSMR
jgi:hypothetical protein